MNVSFERQLAHIRNNLVLKKTYIDNAQFEASSLLRFFIGYALIRNPGLRSAKSAARHAIFFTAECVS